MSEYDRPKDCPFSGRTCYPTLCKIGAYDPRSDGQVCAIKLMASNMVKVSYLLEAIARDIQKKEASDNDRH